MAGMHGFYAHTARDENEKLLPESQWQPLEEHLEEVARLAGQFAADFGAEALAAAAGLLHDLGKMTPEFMDRLRGKALHVDHKTKGTSAACNLYGKQAGKLLAYCILGHHGGLPDCAEDPLYTLCSSAAPQETPDWLDAYLPEKECVRVNPPRNFTVEGLGAYLQLLIRMLFSCLVDADYLDTERFMSPLMHEKRSNAVPAEGLPEKFEPKRKELLSYDLSNPVNAARREVLEACIQAGRELDGFLTLTVPTGGGKTLSSLAFAMEQIKRGKKRVIYAVPFTTVTEQTAKVFRDIFGDELVLEHHSNLDTAGKSDDERDTIRLLSQNWDAPLIVTTTVQLLESLFSHQPSRCRKVHRLAGSVIIFDEAQTLPDKFFLPILHMLKSLASDFGATVVFCTATQPYLRPEWMAGLVPQEIIPKPEKLFAVLRRVRSEHIGKVSDEELVQRLRSAAQALVIVNSRAHALALYLQLAKERSPGGLFHLSALLCPAHRSEVVAQIRERLANALPCLVVSTNLIEAGIDIDFPCVYRAEAGLESLAQSAGRCNREGKLPAGDFYIFAPTDVRAPRFLEESIQAGRKTLKAFSNDPFSPAAVEAYFRSRYHHQARLDVLGIVPHWRDGACQANFFFRDIGQKFRIIENDTHTIFIPYDSMAIEYLREPWRHLRQLQRYAVTVYDVKNTANLTQLFDKTGQPLNEKLWALDPYTQKTYRQDTGFVLMDSESAFLCS